MTFQIANAILKKNGWKKYLFTIAYNGTKFHGVTPQTGVETVAPYLQEACEKFVGKNNVKHLVFSSRTDTGVHAYGNTAHVYLRNRKKQTGKILKPHDTYTLLRGINYYLHSSVGNSKTRIWPKKKKHSSIPSLVLSTSSKIPAINIVNVNSVHDDFHVRHSANGRTYMYHIRRPLVNYTLGNLFDNHLVWTLPIKKTNKLKYMYESKQFMNPSNLLLNVNDMKKAASQCVGKDIDVSAFRSSGCQSSSAVRDIREIDIEEKIIYYQDDKKDDSLFDQLYKRRVTYLGNAYHESNLYLKNNDLLSYQIPIMQEILIKVHGSSFVYNQIRNMVGYFVQVGTGNEDPALTTTHLNEKKRLPYTAPPTGLALMKVHYNESELDPEDDYHDVATF